MTETTPTNVEPGTVEAVFARAWADCHNPDLDGTNPHFRNRFASLKATLKTIRAACAPHGLAYAQHVRVSDGLTVIESTVYTTSGECLRLSSMPVERSTNPQAFGSNMTYAKRQLAQADWGITGDEDDDAEAAAQHASIAPTLEDIIACDSMDTLRDWWSHHPDLHAAINKRAQELTQGGGAQ